MKLRGKIRNNCLRVVGAWKKSNGYPTGCCSHSTGNSLGKEKEEEEEKKKDAETNS